eukprot:3067839-Pyramimonas_sp.AAC.1
MASGAAEAARCSAWHRAEAAQCRALPPWYTTNKQAVSTLSACPMFFPQDVLGSFQDNTTPPISPKTAP